MGEWDSLSSDDEREAELDRLDRIGRTAVKVAASTVLASSLASALGEPPRAEDMTLPEPVPIVRQYEALDEEALFDEEDEDVAATSRWRRLLKALRYLLVALMLAGAVLLAVLKGCAGVVGATLPDDERQEQPSR